MILPSKFKENPNFKKTPRIFKSFSIFNDTTKKVWMTLVSWMVDKVGDYFAFGVLCGVTISFIYTNFWKALKCARKYSTHHYSYTYVEIIVCKQQRHCFVLWATKKESTDKHNTWNLEPILVYWANNSNNLLDRG